MKQAVQQLLKKWLNGISTSLTKKNYIIAQKKAKEETYFYPRQWSCHLWNRGNQYQLDLWRPCLLHLSNTLLLWQRRRQRTWISNKRPGSSSRPRMARHRPPCMKFCPCNQWWFLHTTVLESEKKEKVGKRTSHIYLIQCSITRMRSSAISSSCAVEQSKAMGWRMLRTFSVAAVVQPHFSAETTGNATSVNNFISVTTR